MHVEKRDLKEFLLSQYGSLEKRIIWEREVDVLFAAFDAWFREKHWGKAPAGLSKKLFVKWLKRAEITIIAPNNQREKRNEKSRY